MNRGSLGNKLGQEERFFSPLYLQVTVKQTTAKTPRQRKITLLMEEGRFTLLKQGETDRRPMDGEYEEVSICFFVKPTYNTTGFLLCLYHSTATTVSRPVWSSYTVFCIGK